MVELDDVFAKVIFRDPLLGLWVKLLPNISPYFYNLE